MGRLIISNDRIMFITIAIISASTLYGLSFLNQTQFLLISGILWLGFSFILASTIKEKYCSEHKITPTASIWYYKEACQNWLIYILSLAVFLLVIYKSFSSLPWLEKGDGVLDWGYTNKRPVVYSYIATCILAVSIWAWRYPLRLCGDRSSNCINSAKVTTFIFGGIVAYCAYTFIALPAIHDITLPPSHDSHVNFFAPGSHDNLSSFYEFHRLVHLGVLEEMHHGLLPYVNTQTQYGLGNSIFMLRAMEVMGFSNQAFHVANILVNAFSVVLLFSLFIIVIGPTYSLIALVLWISWAVPSPDTVTTFTGWAFFTRWIGAPVTSLLCIIAFTREERSQPSGFAFLVTGIFMGAFSFLSPENFSASILALLIYGLMMGPLVFGKLKDLMIATVFVVSAALFVYVSLLSLSLGTENILTYFSQSTIKSSQVLSGISNTWWSYSFRVKGHLLLILWTYGLAVAYPLALHNIARRSNRTWENQSAERRVFLVKAGGVISAGASLHTLTLLRSDPGHLAGPSFMVPLAIPIFLAYIYKYSELQCVKFFSVILAIVLGISVASGASGRAKNWLSELENSMTWSKDSFDYVTKVLLNHEAGETFESRYATDPTRQAEISRQPEFSETVDILDKIKRASLGKNVEWLHPGFNKLLNMSEQFYFYGRTVSISGIPSRNMGVWTQSEKKTWIDKIMSSSSGCIFIGSDDESIALLDEWRHRTPEVASLDEAKLKGNRDYGFLSCRVLKEQTNK